MARILHFADLHLDRSFAGPGMTAAEADRRRAELRAALVRIVDFALDLDVDLLTVGGDLYEHGRTTSDTGRFVAQQFQRLAPRKVLVAPGNHDPFVAGSLYDRIQWPENVHVFKQAGWTPLQAAGVTVWGVGHTDPALRKNLLCELRLPASQAAVALLHAADSATARVGRDDHCPFDAEDIEQCGATFVLLGHDHRLRVSPPGAPRYAYPGSPEPLGFFTEGPHYVLLLTMNGQGPCVEPIEISQVTYRTAHLDVTPHSSPRAILRRLRDLARDQPPRAIVRAVLTGQRPPGLHLDAARLRAAAAGWFRYLEVVDATSELSARKAVPCESSCLVG